MFDYAPDSTVDSFIKGFESFVAYPYDDLLPPVHGAYREWTGGPVKGTLTIGYGHTDVARDPLKIVSGLRITEPQAVDILNNDMGEVVEYINQHVTMPFTQGEGDALLSFGFNCGDSNLQNIIRRMNSNHFNDARSAFDLYVYSKGVRLLGLQRRRDGEQSLWDGNPVLVPAEIVHHSACVDAETVH